MFKKIMDNIMNANTADEVATAALEIDVAFQAGKLNWNDHQRLYKLVNKLCDLMS